MFPKLQIYNVFWSICHNLTAFKWWTAVSQAVHLCVCATKQTSDYTPATWRRTDVHLENPEYHTRWFFKYFLGKGQCCSVENPSMLAHEPKG